MDIRQQIIDSAKTFLGKKYSEMDCSKYCQKVFKPLGLELPRTSVEQAKFVYNKKLTIEFPESAKLADILPKLKPGDLVFWRQVDTKKGWPYCGNSRCGGGKCKRWNGIHHVGIYAGNGDLYESITSAGKVIFRKLWESAGWQIIFAADVTNLLTGKNAQEGGGDFMIKYKDKDADKAGKVAVWQLVLKALGYDMGIWPDKDNKATGIDGSYGNHTRTQTASMKQKYGLAGNGELVDERTLFVGVSAVIAKGGDTSAITEALNAANAKIEAAKTALA